jgi:LacI family transcriptional regulator
VAINLKQLSARLRLSPTTVSRALNGYSDVSDATRLRVTTMARELGYEPNMAARRLALGRAEAVGIVYPVETEFMGNPLFLEMIGGVSARLEEAGFDVLLAVARESSELLTYERMVKGRRVDGLIVAHTRVKDPRIDFLKKAGLPFVAYGRTAKSDDFAWFDFDNEEGTAMAVRELAALGHRRIAYVHCQLDYNFAQQRRQGFLRAMKAAGLPLVADYQRVGGLDRRGGYAAAMALLALKRPPSAIVVDNNLCGIGVVRALMQSGVEIGKTISVVVHEGVPSDTLLIGQDVAAIDQPSARESGATIAGMLLTLIERKPLRQRHVLKQPRFVPGRSIGPAPG